MPPESQQLERLSSKPSEPPLADAYLRHRAWLERLLARRYGHDLAADVAQDTWLAVHRYFPPAPVRRPAALLARIALRVAAKRVRKAARETPTDPHHESLASGATHASQEQAVFFEQILLALSPKLRDVFALSHVKGLTYREIGQLRGISVKTVEKRMNQALAQCEDMVRG